LGEKRASYYKLPKKSIITDDYISSRNQREEIKHKMEMAVMLSKININVLKADLLANELRGKSTVSNILYLTGFLL
jgi:hypothetical protein